MDQKFLRALLATIESCPSPRSCWNNTLKYSVFVVTLVRSLSARVQYSTTVLFTISLLLLYALEVDWLDVPIGIVGWALAFVVLFVSLTTSADRSLCTVSVWKLEMVCSVPWNTHCSCMFSHAALNINVSRFRGLKVIGWSSSSLYYSSQLSTWPSEYPPLLLKCVLNHLFIRWGRRSWGNRKRRLTAWQRRESTCGFHKQYKSHWNRTQGGS